MKTRSRSKTILHRPRLLEVPGWPFSNRWALERRAVQGRLPMQTASPVVRRVPAAV